MALAALLTACANSATITTECPSGQTHVYYADTDGDGFGDVNHRTVTCDAQASAVTDATDCDDTNAAANPAAAEVCDTAGVDEDCDGLVNDRDATLDPTGRQTFYADADGDGYGDASLPTTACAAPAGAVTDATDCDDTNAAVHPDATEVCDGLDTDCDVATSEDGLATFADVNGTTDRTGEFAAGSPANPADITLDEPGTLSLCVGRWYATITMSADVDLVAPAGAEVTQINAATRGPVVRLRGNDHAFTIRGFTLEAGRGERGFSTDDAEKTAGGGVSCIGNSTLNIHDSALTGNAADLGGGIAIDECLLYLWDSTVAENEAGTGAGVYIRRGNVELNGSVIHANAATVTAGGIAVAPESNEDAYLSVANTLVSENAAPMAAGLLVQPPVEVQCYGDVNERTGFLSNASDEGGAIVLTGGASFESLLCDFGAADSADDNAPSDVTEDDGEHAYGDDAGFLCYRGACADK